MSQRSLSQSKITTLLSSLQSEKLHRALLVASTTLTIIASFLLALYIRLQDALMWGWYLRAFDPYIRYYLAKFLVDAGILNGILWWISGGKAVFLSHSVIEKYRIVVHHGYTYFTQFWYPWYIDWAKSLSPGVSLIAAVMYTLLRGLGLSFHETAVLSPAIFNALSVFALAYLVWRISHPDVRLYAASLAAVWGAVSPFFTMRGTAGWLDDVPFFQFFAVLALAFTIEAAVRSRLRERVPFLVLAFLTNGFTTWIWGGYVYLFNIYGLAAVALSLYVLVTGRRVDLDKFALAYMATYLGFVTFILLTPRYSIHTLTSGLSVIPHLGTVLILLTVGLLKLPEEKFSKTVRVARYVIAVAVIGMLAVTALSITGLIKVKALAIHGRYLSVLIPLARPPIIRSVAEHAYVSPSALSEHVGFSYVPVIVSVAGLLTSPTPVTVLLALACISATYLTMSMMFLLYLLAIVWIPVALYSLSVALRIRGFILPILIAVVCVACIAGSIIQTASTGVKATVAPPEILSQPPYKIYDWIYTLEWLKYKTPQNAAVVAWWDYGYWISVVANRTSLADNSTVNRTQIAWIARLFLADTENRTRILNILEHLGRPDYILTYMPYSVLQYDGYCVGIPEVPAGGDFVKSYWMALIAGYSRRYIYSNLISIGIPVGYGVKPNIVRLQGTAVLRVIVPYTTRPLLYRLLFSPDVLAQSPWCDDLTPAWVFQKNVLVPTRSGNEITLRLGFPFYEGTRTVVLGLPRWIKLEYEPYVPLGLAETTGRIVFGWTPVFKIEYSKIRSSR